MKVETISLIANVPVDLFNWFSKHCRDNALNRSALVRKFIDDYRKSVEGGKE